jgi:PadR family transcriptional regulator
MGSGPRMSRATQVVLEAFLSDPTQELSGVQVCAGAGVGVGSVHPILARLEGMGWLESRWEDLDPDEDRRPPRRYYRLTGVGSTLAPAAAAQRHRPAPFARWRPATGQP